MALLFVMLLLQIQLTHRKTFSISHLVEPGMLFILLNVILFVTLLGGSYPGLFRVSSQLPVLKGKFAFGKVKCVPSSFDRITVYGSINSFDRKRNSCPADGFDAKFKTERGR